MRRQVFKRYLALAARLLEKDQVQVGGYACTCASLLADSSRPFVTLAFSCEDNFHHGDATFVGGRCQRGHGRLTVITPTTIPMATSLFC